MVYLCSFLSEGYFVQHDAMEVVRPAIQGLDFMETLLVYSFNEDKKSKTKNKWLPAPNKQQIKRLCVLYQTGDASLSDLQRVSIYLNSQSPK